MEKSINKYERVLQVIDIRKQNGGIKNTSGYKGVTSDKRPGRKPFRSAFSLTWKDKKIIIGLGYYNSLEEAYIARIKFIDSLK